MKTLKNKMLWLLLLVGSATLITGAECDVDVDTDDDDGVFKQVVNVYGFDA